MLQRLVKKEFGEGSVEILEVDVDSQIDFAKEAEVQGTPTIQVYANGQLVQSVRGVEPRAKYIEALLAAFGGNPPLADGGAAPAAAAPAAAAPAPAAAPAAAPVAAAAPAPAPSAEGGFAQWIGGVEGVSIVKFVSPTCGACRALAPMLQRLVKKEFGEGSVQILEVDVDSQVEFAKEAAVMGTPTIQVYAGGQLVESVRGVEPKAAYIEALKTAFAK